MLASIGGLGPASLGALLRTYGSGRRILGLAGSGAGRRRLATTKVNDRRSLGHELAEQIGAAGADRRRLLDAIAAEGLFLVTIEDETYPARLRAIETPPPVLFVRGNSAAIDMPRTVAVVGTRRPTERGRRLAGWIASAIADQGACVVSGLAIGIDGAAHAAVVGRGGATVGVLGGGHRAIYPRAHRRLAEAIVAVGGAVISELPPAGLPTRGTFPRRNRVISGLSEATVVVEAGHRSGALITACWTLEQGRDCYMVPGSIDEPASAGCLAFLRAYPDRARLVAGIPELLDDLGLVPSGGEAASVATGSADASRGADDIVDPPDVARRAGAAGDDLGAVPAGLGRSEGAVAGALAEGASSLDAIVAATGLEAATVLGTLTLLEIRGLVISAYGRYRAAGRLAGWPGPGTARRLRRPG